MNKKKKIFGFIAGLIFATALVFSPLASVKTASAIWKIGDPLVPKCGTVTTETNTDGTPKIDPQTKKPIISKEIKNPCDFNHLMQLVNNVIDFLLFWLATPLIALILVYAGILMLTSGGSTESVTKVKKIIKNVVFGYIIALAAWLIIHTILTTLGVDPKPFLE